MDESNDILKALGQIPELTEAAKRILAADEEFKKLVAEILKQRMQAEFTPEERQSIIADIIEVIKETPCAMPDLDAMSEKFADKAAAAFTQKLDKGIKDKIDDAFENAKVRHVYSFIRPQDLLDVMEPRAKKWTVVATALCAVLLLIITVSGVARHHSDEHYGKLYLEVVTSEYTTDEEHEMLRKNTIPLSALPSEYRENSKLVRQHIKRNQEILKQRKKEAKVNDGAFSAKIPLER
jgi:hypothetical protein